MATAGDLIIAARKLQAKTPGSTMYTALSRVVYQQPVPVTKPSSSGGGSGGRGRTTTGTTTTAPATTTNPTPASLPPVVSVTPAIPPTFAGQGGTAYYIKPSGQFSYNVTGAIPTGATQVSKEEYSQTALKPSTMTSYSQGKGRDIGGGKVAVEQGGRLTIYDPSLNPEKDSRAYNAGLIDTAIASGSLSPLATKKWTQAKADILQKKPQATMGNTEMFTNPTAGGSPSFSARNELQTMASKVGDTSSLPSSNPYGLGTADIKPASINPYEKIQDDAKFYGYGMSQGTPTPIEGRSSVNPYEKIQNYAQSFGTGKSVGVPTPAVVELQRTNVLKKELDLSLMTLPNSEDVNIRTKKLAALKERKDIIDANQELLTYAVQMQSDIDFMKSQGQDTSKIELDLAPTLKRLSDAGVSVSENMKYNEDVENAPVFTPQEIDSYDNYNRIAKEYNIQSRRYDNAWKNENPPHTLGAALERAGGETRFTLPTSLQFGSGKNPDNFYRYTEGKEFMVNMTHDVPGPLAYEPKSHTHIPLIGTQIDTPFLQGTTNFLGEIIKPEQTRTTLRNINEKALADDEKFLASLVGKNDILSNIRRTAIEAQIRNKKYVNPFVVDIVHGVETGIVTEPFTVGATAATAGTLGYISKVASVPGIVLKPWMTKLGIGSIIGGETYGFVKAPNKGEFVGREVLNLGTSYAGWQAGRNLGTYQMTPQASGLGTLKITDEWATNPDSSNIRFRYGYETATKTQDYKYPWSPIADVLSRGARKPFTTTTDIERMMLSSPIDDSLRIYGTSTMNRPGFPSVKKGFNYKLESGKPFESGEFIASDYIPVLQQPFKGTMQSGGIGPFGEGRGSSYSPYSAVRTLIDVPYASSPRAPNPFLGSLTELNTKGKVTGVTSFMGSGSGPTSESFSYQITALNVPKNKFELEKFIGEAKKFLPIGKKGELAMFRMPGGSSRMPGGSSRMHGGSSRMPGGSSRMPGGSTTFPFDGGDTFGTGGSGAWIGGAGEVGGKIESDIGNTPNAIYGPNFLPSSSAKNNLGIMPLFPSGVGVGSGVGGNSEPLSRAFYSPSYEPKSQFGPAGGVGVLLGFDTGHAVIPVPQAMDVPEYIPSAVGDTASPDRPYIEPPIPDIPSPVIIPPSPIIPGLGPLPLALGLGTGAFSGFQSTSVRRSGGRGVGTWGIKNPIRDLWSEYFVIPARQRMAQEGLMKQQATNAYNAQVRAQQPNQKERAMNAVNRLLGGVRKMDSRKASYMSGGKGRISGMM